MQFVCPVCGYVYDEAKQAVPFSQLPRDWVCPVCKAARSAFAAEAEPVQAAAPAASRAPQELPEGYNVLSLGQLAAVCSNLARGCEKQYRAREAALFRQLAASFTEQVPAVEDAYTDRIAAELMTDVSERIPAARATAINNGDRGAQRVLVWNEKVTRMQQSLLRQYMEDGEKMLEGKRVFVCTACGFIYVGEEAPEQCPVCKVPDWKFEEAEGKVF